MKTLIPTAQHMRLAADIAKDYSDMPEDDLRRLAHSTADHYMLYAVKPLSEYSDHSDRANEMRAETQRLLAELWLRLDAELETRR